MLSAPPTGGAVGPRAQGVNGDHGGTLQGTMVYEDSTSVTFMFEMEQVTQSNFGVQTIPRKSICVQDCPINCDIVCIPILRTVITYKHVGNTVFVDSKIIQNNDISLAQAGKTLTVHNEKRWKLHEVSVFNGPTFGPFADLYFPSPNG